MSIFLSLLAFAKALSPIVLQLLLRITLWRFVQPSNALFPIAPTPDGISICSIFETPEKASSPIKYIVLEILSTLAVPDLTTYLGLSNVSGTISVCFSSFISGVDGSSSVYS